MSDKEKLDIIYKILTLILLGISILIGIKLCKIYKRVNILEKDYKIYEINLQNLEENKDVQFEY